MKTVLIWDNQQIEIFNPYIMIPRKGSHIVFNNWEYTVKQVDINYDSNIVYIIAENYRK